MVSSSKLKVKLSATTARRRIELDGEQGEEDAGLQRGMDLAAGSSQTIALRLSRAGRNTLKNAGSAKVKVTATVPGASPANATQRLR